MSFIDWHRERRIPYGPPGGSMNRRRTRRRSGVLTRMAVTYRNASAGRISGATLL
jgi:hypothetical protein